MVKKETTEDKNTVAHQRAARTIFWAAAWLAVVFVSMKAYYLGLPTASGRTSHDKPFLAALAAISYLDVAFVVFLWSTTRLLLFAVARWKLVARYVSAGFVAFAALSCLYAVGNVLMFASFGGFVTYQLLALVASVRMLRSSVSVYITPGVGAALIGFPLAFVVTVLSTVRFVRARQTGWARDGIAALVAALAWIVLGHQSYESTWGTRSDRRIADNAQWVFAASWWQAIGGATVRMNDEFGAADLADFEPIGVKRPPTAPLAIRRVLATTHASAASRPLNVIFVVLESVAARWTSISGGTYATTPMLAAEARQGIVFDKFYAHIGRSSNSLISMLLSTYPKLGFRDITEEYPQLPGTSLANAFRQQGYRTGFFTPSDMAWAGWGDFLRGRGFDEIRDHHQLSCSELLSSWGVEDRCMFDGLIDAIARETSRPFFFMGWTTQTHHPYEPTPGVPLLDLMREKVEDDWDLGRYLNVIHETDRHLGRLFDALRQARLDQDTLVVVTGDHGQAFGWPHEGDYTQGRAVHEEDVHVPLLLWMPRRYRSPQHSAVVGSHVDLAPTIAELAGVPAAADWQGRSLFAAARMPRAYFYVAEDNFQLGVREHDWKYIFDLREGSEELYDLNRDPAEQHNLAASHPDLTTRLRQRLAAWTEANHRQYQGPGVRD